MKFISNKLLSTPLQCNKQNQHKFWYNFPKESIISGYIRNFKKNTQNGVGVYLEGVPGTGKTRFCYSYLKKYIWTYISAKNAFKCHFTTFKELHDKILKADDKIQQIRTYGGYTLLLIDEFCVKDQMTEAERNNLLEILNIRIRNIPVGKPTIFTSNQSIEEIKKIAGEAIHDRIIGNCIIHKMNSKSRRTIENRLVLD